MNRIVSHRAAIVSLTIILLAQLSASEALAAGRVRGYVYDISGHPVAQALVTIKADANHIGPDYFTAFSDAQGRISFPDALTGVADPDQQVRTRVLGYELERVASESGAGAQTLTVILRTTSNYAATAPASAWLAKLNPEEKEKLLTRCTACHQTLIPQQRYYGKLVHDVTEPNDVESRKRLWHNLTKYMGYMGIEEFQRGVSVVSLPDVGYGTEGNVDDEVTNTIVKVTDMFGPAVDRLDHYDYGAPLAVTSDTVIMEYEVPRPNAVREAVMLGNPAKLYVADSYLQGVHEIDVATGKQETLKFPTQKGGPGSHSLYRGGDGTLWVTCTCSTLAHYDPKKRSWQTWDVSQHDLAIDSDSGNTIATDYKGRVWIAGGGSTTEYLGNYPGIGYVDPKSGDIKSFQPPQIQGRPPNGLVYKAVITSDRKHLWYTMPGGAAFGEINLETLQFGKQVIMPAGSAPHRLAITEDDILYVPLMDSGQLAVYDARAGKPLGIYDLPDRAAVPYAATYDPVRQVIWTANSNADSIYRFDIKTESWSVLPLPRTNAFLRQVDINTETGLLTTSYANLPYPVHGPRMALIIDPGDHAYPKGKGAIAKLLTPASATVVKSPTAEPPPPAETDPAKLIQQGRCFVCHDMTKTERLGPPYSAIATRYADADKNVMADVLAEKIVKGGGLNWGQMVMVENAQRVSFEEARVIAEWILNLEPAAEEAAKPMAGSN